MSLHLLTLLPLSLPTTSVLSMNLGAEYHQRPVQRGRVSIPMPYFLGLDVILGLMALSPAWRI